MKKLLFLTLFVGIGVFFTDCQSSGQPDDATTTVDFKHDENIVYSRLRADADNLNPYYATTSYSQEVYKFIFPYMLYFSPKTLELEPILVKERAKVEEVSEGKYAGGLSYTFEFLDEVKWDNGEDVTGEDILFSLKVMFNPKVPAQRARIGYEFIEEMVIDKENPKKFTFFTMERYILSEVQLSTILLYPEYIYDPEGLLKDFALEDLMDTEKANALAEKDDRLQKFADHFSQSKFAREKGSVVSCGAYELDEWETGQRIILKKKENWWGEGLSEKYHMLEASPEEIHFKVMADQTAAVAALRDQELDAIDQMQAEDFIELSKDERMQDLYDFKKPARLVGYGVAFNLRNNKFNDKKVRRAIAHLYDINNIIENLLYGMGAPVTNPVHPSKSYHADNLPVIEYDVDKARKLLTDAGWSDTNNDGTVDKEIDGEQLELEINYLVSSSNEEEIALLFQNSAKEAGVGVNISKKEFVTKMGDIRKNEFDMAAIGWRTYPIPYDPKQIWHSSSAVAGGSNYSGFTNDEVDELIDKIRVEIDDNKRDMMYQRFQEIIYDEQPYVFLFTPLNPTAISKRFDAESSSIGYFPNMFELKKNNLSMN